MEKRFFQVKLVGENGKKTVTRLIDVERISQVEFFMEDPEKHGPNDMLKILLADGHNLEMKGKDAERLWKELRGLSINKEPPTLMVV